MNLSTAIFAVMFFLLVDESAHSQVKQNTQPQISASTPVAPILKGVKVNPVLRIRAYVPMGSANISINQLKGKVNGIGWQSIEKFELFFAGAEAMLMPDSLAATVTPISGNIEIPFNRKFKPGLNYIWISVTLKETADPDIKIEFHATALVNSAGKSLPVVEEPGEYLKRIGVAIRKAGDEGVHTFRIPGIITTDKGTLIAVYDIRYTNTRDLPGNIDVGTSRSIDGGKTWSAIQVIMDMGAPHGNNGVGDPSILFDPTTRKIWVSALWSKGNRSIAGSQPGLSPDETGQFALVSSGDDGLTWTTPISITQQVKNPSWKLFFPGPGNGIAMEDGKIVFPAQYWDTLHTPHSTLVYSDDHGKSWKRGIAAKTNTTESQLVETTPGTLMINMRDNRGKFRSIATTTNMGQEWLEHHTSYSALPDPVCMASIFKAKFRVRGQIQDVLFFSNANSSTARINISVKASLDLGESWKLNHQLLIDERPTYGYSALTKVDDNTLGLVYEGIRDLYFVRIPLKEIIR